MRLVCPQDVKKMLLKQAGIYWKKWAATHECVELKEGVWLEPIQASLRRNTNEAWTDKHRNVLRNLVVEGGWVCHVGWSDEKRSVEAVPLSVWREVRNQISKRLEATCQSKDVNLKSIKTRACQLKTSGTRSPPTALCWESQAGGVRAGGQRCSLTTTERDCADARARNPGSWVDGLLVSHQESYRPYEGSCLQQRDH